MMPEPLPPITAKTSARRTSRLMPACTTCSPKRVQTLRISTTVSGVRVVSPLLVMSEIEYAEGNGKQGIGHDHQKDRLDHAARGLTAHAVGTAPRAKTLKAANHRNNPRKHRRLADANQIGRDAD